MQGGNIFYVEKILKKQSYPVLKYLVKWEGYDVKDSTWEPIENLKDVQDLIDEFEAKQEANISHNQKRRREASASAEDQLPETSSKDILLKEDQKKISPREIIREYLDDDEFPEKVVNAKIINDKLYCLVRLMERSDGIVPEDCYIPSSYLTERYPKMIIDFYESKLKFIY